MGFRQNPFAAPNIGTVEGGVQDQATPYQWTITLSSSYLRWRLSIDWIRLNRHPSLG